jgi:hypothetical protein
VYQFFGLCSSVSHEKYLFQLFARMPYFKMKKTVTEKIIYPLRVMKSSSFTCRSTEMIILALTAIKAGTRFEDPEAVKG